MAHSPIFGHPHGGMHKKHKQTGQERAGQEKKRQDRKGQGRTGHGTGQGGTRQTMTGQDRTGRERKGRDRKGQDREKTRKLHYFKAYAGSTVFPVVGTGRKIFTYTKLQCRKCIDKLRKGKLAIKATENKLQYEKSNFNRLAQQDYTASCVITSLHFTVIIKKHFNII
jgi:hypothetical protein